MTTATLTASSDRPLALRRRADLIARRQRWQGREYWTIKDPVALRYYRFEDEEYSILSMLDGQMTPQQIRDRFESQFAPQRLSAAQLQHLLTLLHKSQLLLADAPGQGEKFLERHKDKERKKRLGTLANLLAIRFRGIDPDALLAALDRHAGWLFSEGAAAFAAALICSAALLIAAEFETFTARLPSFRTFFGLHNWFWLTITLCVTKIIHEFGHGLACKRFGGECHEMGVMLLVGTPCLYCNVSDSWMIPSKWRRAAVGAAGMYFELILASLATFLWWFSEPGLLNHLALNVMFVCSVSTLLFNANPLMRFDGYYILSDLIEIPNLRQKSQAVIQRALGVYVLGLPHRADPFLPQRRQWLFAAYSIASTVYSWLVTISILWFLYRVLEPYGLKIIGQLLVAAMLAGIVALPLVRIKNWLLEPLRRSNVKKLRAFTVVASLAALLAAVLCVPLPYYIAASFELRPRDSASVYVEMPGELREIVVRAGAVTAGQALARLDDIDARLNVERLISQRSDIFVRIESIRQRAHTDDAALLELSQTEEALFSLDRQITRLKEDLARHTIRAPCSGIFIPPAARPAEARDRLHLASWHGRPLEARNLGAFFPASTLIGRIAQPGALEAILIIDQDELDFARPGQAVDLFLTALPGERRTGFIERIAEENLRAAPQALTAGAGGNLATRADSQGIQRPLSVAYQANVPVDDPTGQIAVGSTGWARIHAGSQPLWHRLGRLACRTFRFKM